MEVGDPPAVAPHEDVPLLLEARRLRPLQHLPLVEDLEGKISDERGKDQFIYIIGFRQRRSQ